MINKVTNIILSSCIKMNWKKEKIGKRVIWILNLKEKKSMLPTVRSSGAITEDLRNVYARTKLDGWEYKSKIEQKVALEIVPHKQGQVYLSPKFAEWVMGYPIDYTNLGG